jgi:signal transduction histidine kinase
MVCCIKRFRLSKANTQIPQAFPESEFAAASVTRAALRGEDLPLVPANSGTSFVHDLPNVFAALAASTPARYAAALAAIALASLGRWLLVPVLGDHVPFALVYAGVVISALYLGLGPSIGASVMGMIFVRLVFAPHFFAISSVTELSEILTYIGGCTLITAATEVTRKSRNKLKLANRELALRAGALRTFNEQLERRVHERTAELAKAEESARQLGAQVLKMQDVERRRIARDLHDSIGQAVAILNMNLGELGRSNNLSQSESAIISDSKAIAEGVADEVRTISHLLHPPLLDELGLPAALKWYVRGFSKRSGISAHLELSDEFGRLPADCEIAIFRIVQEALTNVHRHSGSPSVAVRVMWTPASVRLEIEDEGKGIPAEEQQGFSPNGAMGVGLRGMRERVAQLGGRLDLQSSESGTTVSATFPLNVDDAIMIASHSLA